MIIVFVNRPVACIRTFVHHPMCSNSKIQNFSLDNLMDSQFLFSSHMILNQKPVNDIEMISNSRSDEDERHGAVGG